MPDRPSVLDEYLDEQECALELNKDVRTLQRWRQLRTGPNYTMNGRTVLYRRGAIADWLLAQEKPMQRASSKRALGKGKGSKPMPPGRWTLNKQKARAARRKSVRLWLSKQEPTPVRETQRMTAGSRRHGHDQTSGLSRKTKQESEAPDLDRTATRSPAEFGFEASGNRRSVAADFLALCADDLRRITS